MTYLELARAALRGGTDEEAEFALWERTPFPFETNPRILFKKIDGYRRGCANGRRFCDFCHRQADDGWTCKSCATALTAGVTR
jgi:hypothetical protein